jgi:hypothetical protein
VIGINVRARLTLRTAMPQSCLRVVAIATLALVEVSCGGECWIADQAYVLDTRDGLYLVYRVTGFHDKVHFFEVYRGKPAFDSCGRTEAVAIAPATAFYEPHAGRLLKKVEWDGNRLEIVYTSDRSEAIDPREARFSQ